jgi:PAS domain S-box-containing protein
MDSRGAEAQGQSPDHRDADARRWREWFERCVDPMVIVGADLTILDTNEASEGLLLASRDEIIGRNYVDFLAADDVAMLEEALARIVETGSAEFAPSFTRGDGSLVPVEAQVVRFDDGTFVGRAREVSKMLQSDVTLARKFRNEELFEGFLRYLPGNAFLKDEDGRYLYANPHLAANRGFAPHEMIGRTDEELLPTDRAAELSVQDDLVRRRREPVEFRRTRSSCTLNSAARSCTSWSSSSPWEKRSGGISSVASCLTKPSVCWPSSTSGRASSVSAPWWRTRRTRSQRPGRAAGMCSGTPPCAR